MGDVYVEKRTSTAIQSVPALARLAFVSAEDKRFYRHRGLDPVAIMRAAFTACRSMRLRQGGSTITQQLVRNAILHDRRRLPWRKVREALGALRLERACSKHQILEAYLNAIWFGHGVYGIHAAADYYFGIRPERLTLTQAALLAGIVRAPGRLSPFVNAAAAARRRNYVLRRMHEDGHIDAHSYETAVKSPLPALRRSRAKSPGGQVLERYFIDSLSRELGNHPSLRYPVHRLKIRATLDRLCQTAVCRAARAFNRSSPTRRIALLITDPRVGNVMGFANGHSYDEHQFDTVASGALQPGSTMKPFVLVAALKAGLTLDTCYHSEPVDLALDDGQLWRVRNHDGTYRGRMSIADALVHSDNSVFAQLARDIGLASICEVLEAVHVPLRSPTIAVSLGAFARGIPLLALARAYTVFANEGRLAETSVFSEVDDLTLGTTARRFSEIRPVLDRGICREVDSVLARVAQSGTALGVAPGHDLRAKTGTTQQGSLLVCYDSFLQLTTWVETKKALVTGPPPPKALSAADLAKRVWYWLDRFNYFGEAWGLLRGYERLSPAEKMQLGADFV